MSGIRILNIWAMTNEGMKNRRLSNQVVSNHRQNYEKIEDCKTDENMERGPAES